MNKKLILTATVLICLSISVMAQSDFLAGFFQDLSYGVHPRHSRPVEKQLLRSAKFVSELMEGYPRNWISSYVSVEILATCKGKTMKAQSATAALNIEQKWLLKEADLATPLIINVKYMYRDPVTGTVEHNQMHVSMIVVSNTEAGYGAMTLVPETRAEYSGGAQNMINYLKEHSLGKIMAIQPALVQQGLLRFTVNEAGKISQAAISHTFGDPEIDRLLLETIANMPAWKPAKNAKGICLKQEFEFSIGNPGC